MFNSAIDRSNYNILAAIASVQEYIKLIEYYTLQSTQNSKVARMLITIEVINRLSWLVLQKNHIEGENNMYYQFL